MSKRVSHTFCLMRNKKIKLFLWPIKVTVTQKSYLKQMPTPLAWAVHLQNPNNLLRRSPCKPSALLSVRHALLLDQSKPELILTSFILWLASLLSSPSFYADQVQQSTTAVCSRCALRLTAHHHFNCFPALPNLWPSHSSSASFSSALKISFTVFFCVGLLVAIYIYLPKNAYFTFVWRDFHCIENFRLAGVFLHTQTIWFHYLLVSVASLRSRRQSNCCSSEDSTFSRPSFKAPHFHFIFSSFTLCQGVTAPLPGGGHRTRHTSANPPLSVSALERDTGEGIWHAADLQTHHRPSKHLHAQLPGRPPQLSQRARSAAKDR